MSSTRITPASTLKAFLRANPALGLLSGRVWFDGDFVSFVAGWTGRHWSYDIDLDRLRTQDQVNEWVRHVGSKTWATPDLMSDFKIICEAIRAAGLTSREAGR